MNQPSNEAMTLKVIAHIHTAFPTKFGIPRQSGLVDSLRGEIVFTPEYRSPDAVRGLEDFKVEIEDNGKGIAAKDLPYIFDRFYRTDVSRNSSKGGSGIGLSIVKKIMEDHGGKVWATSRLGIGTIMYFVLRKYQEVPMNE